jgi:cullin 1
MIQDLKISGELQDSYREWQCVDLAIGHLSTNRDDSFKVLYSGFWPLTPPTTAFLPPKEILARCTHFEEFYAQKYEGRKLTWLWNLSRAELRTNYVKWNSWIPYTFQLSAFQMSILLLFNEKEKVSYTEVEDKTALDKTILGPCLGSLVKAKVLTAQPADVKADHGSEYSLNFGFKSRSCRVPLYIMIKSERNKEAERTYRAQGDERRLVIQVSILSMHEPFYMAFLYGSIQAKICPIVRNHSHNEESQENGVY